MYAFIVLITSLHKDFRVIVLLMYYNCLAESTKLLFLCVTTQARVIKKERTMSGCKAVYMRTPH